MPIFNGNLQQGLSFTNNKAWWIVLTVVAFVNESTRNGGASLTETFGGVIGQFIMAYSFHRHPLLWSVMIRKRLSPTQYTSTFTVAMVIIMALFYLGAIGC